MTSIHSHILALAFGLVARKPVRAERPKWRQKKQEKVKIGISLPLSETSTMNYHKVFQLVEKQIINTLLGANIFMVLTLKSFLFSRKLSREGERKFCESKYYNGLNDRYRCLFVSCACVLSLSLSLNSRRHVVAILSARGEKARFRMRVTLGAILIRSLVNTKHVPGRLRSGSGVALE